jgi:hypothetical protein
MEMIGEYAQSNTSCRLEKRMCIMTCATLVLAEVNLSLSYVL